MEIDGENGSKFLLKEGSKTELGRGLGFDSNDRTVSRRHVSFDLHSSDQTHEFRVHLEVIGKNPIWVYSTKSNEIRALRRSERVETEVGDKFCVSAKNPVWFTLNKIKSSENNEILVNQELGFKHELAENLDSTSESRNIEEIELESLDISNIDPVKEFGFLVKGHEFDCYPKKKISDFKNWDWFLEEDGEDREDDEEVRERRKKKKRKKGEGGDDDDEWTGESENEIELKAKSKNTSKYLTRSKDNNKTRSSIRGSKKSRTKKIARTNEEEEEEDETLGGFIVTDDDEVEQEGESDDDDEEEEEFDEDEEEVDE